jgi:hypothetical protein
MHAPRRTLPLALLTIVAAVSGCGGSGSEPDPVLRHEYIAEADAFCKAANEQAAGDNERIQRIVERAKTAEDALAEIAPVIEAAYQRQGAQVADFRRIEPPARDREAIERLWAAYDERQVMLGRLADAARDRDAPRFESLVARQRRIKARGDALAQGYGFRECGSGEDRGAASRAATAS